jgi:hypothetical protein
VRLGIAEAFARGRHHLAAPLACASNRYSAASTMSTIGGPCSSDLVFCGAQLLGRERVEDGERSNENAKHGEADEQNLDVSWHRDLLSAEHSEASFDD